MKPLLQSPTPSITASSRVEQSPWETKSMTHTVGQSQCLFTPFQTQQTAAPLAWGNSMFVRLVMINFEPGHVIIISVCNKDNEGLSLAALFKVTKRWKMQNNGKKETKKNKTQPPGAFIVLWLNEIDIFTCKSSQSTSLLAGTTDLKVFRWWSLSLQEWKKKSVQNVFLQYKACEMKKKAYCLTVGYVW